MAALEEIRGLDPGGVSDPLRTALIAALEREARVQSELRSGALPRLEYPELIARLALVVGPLRDPRAVDGLAGALGAAPPAMDYLAGFGDAGAAAILRVLESGPGTAAEQDGLIALRFVVENQGEAPLTGQTRSRIRELASGYLQGGRHVTMFWRAIDLAAALDDPVLIDTLESLAEPGALAARGIAARDLARTQRLLADRLAGVPPLPRFGQ